MPPSIMRAQSASMTRFDCEFVTVNAGVRPPLQIVAQLLMRQRRGGRASLQGSAAALQIVHQLRPPTPRCSSELLSAYGQLEGHL